MDCYISQEEQIVDENWEGIVMTEDNLRASKVF